MARNPYADALAVLALAVIVIGVVAALAVVLGAVAGR